MLKAQAKKLAPISLCKHNFDGQKMTIKIFNAKKDAVSFSLSKLDFFTSFHTKSHISTLALLSHSLNRVVVAKKFVKLSSDNDEFKRECLSAQNMMCHIFVSIFIYSSIY